MRPQFLLPPTDITLPEGWYSAFAPALAERDDIERVYLVRERYPDGTEQDVLHDERLDPPGNGGASSEVFLAARGVHRGAAGRDDLHVHAATASRGGERGGSTHLGAEVTGSARVRSCDIGTNSTHLRDGSARTVPEGGPRAPQRGAGPWARSESAERARPAATGATRHLYVHLPFCVHRCGYCDFVTAVGKTADHGPYVDALLGELALERHLLAPEVETIFLGGGTPTFTEPAALARLLAALPAADELTVEANPETVTPALAALLREHGVNRISLGAQSFRPHLLAVLERRTTPAGVRAAFAALREAGFENLSLDLIYGIPGQSADDLARDLADALELGPEHLSCYELEAKPGTRFTHAHGAELERQADAMEGYFETVVETLTSTGYRWYETANFCRADDGRDLRARHNLGYWLGRDYLGVGVGAVSTVAGLRWRNAPSVPRYVSALSSGEHPARELEPLAAETQARERVLLGLRLDEPLPTAGLDAALDPDAVERLQRLGLARTLDGGALLELTPRGRFLGGGVTAELLT